MKKIRFPLFLITFSLLGVLPLLSSNLDNWKAEEYYQHSSSQKDAATDLLKYVSFKGDERILDVGCGDGKITAEIATQLPNGSALGVDISPSMICFAQANFSSEHYHNLHFSLQDAQALNYQEEFDIIFSFTALQWVQSHEAFLKGAYQSIKPAGVLAITMPVGLPSTLEQAIREQLSSPEWSSYFKEFSTGWNFVEKDDYAQFLSAQHFTSTRLAVVPQKDIFPSREDFQKFISQWFPYLRPLPEQLKQSFLNQVVDRFLELESPFPNGEVHFKIRRLEVVAIKS